MTTRTTSKSSSLRASRWLLAIMAVGGFDIAQAGASQPTDATQAAIFAGGNLTFRSFSTVSGGDVLANGKVAHLGGLLNVEAMYAGGTFTAGGAAYQNAAGDLLFGGDVLGLGGPGVLLAGDVVSGGDIGFLASSQTVGGNVVAAGSVSVPFSFATIDGNLVAGGDVTLDGTVIGDVTHGGSLTLGAFASIGGTAAPGGPVTPTPYQPLSLPGATQFASTGLDVTLNAFQDIALAPGNYGTLAFAYGNTVTLTAGEYVFADIVSSFSLNELSFDTSGGPISLFIDGDLTFDLVQVLNGESVLFGAPDASLSELIRVEVAGSYVGDAEFFGTVFAPAGNITLGNFADHTGRLLAAGDVTLYNVDVTVVPEPVAGLTTAAAVSALTLLRRRS